MLRIAVPNKGSLSEAATDMLRESGYRQRTSSHDLVLSDPDNDVEFFYLRPRDIAVYVGSGTLDVGLTGRDLLLDSGAQAQEILQLGFGRSTFRFAGAARRRRRGRRPGRPAGRDVLRRAARAPPGRARRRRRTSSGWTVRSSRRSGWASRTSSRTSCRPAAP